MNNMMTNFHKLKITKINIKNENNILVIGKYTI